MVSAIQAALLGQGIALGWLNSMTYWLSTGALVPGEQEAVVVVSLWPD